MAIEAKPPQEWPQGKFTVFLAGAIDMGRAGPWQSYVAKQLSAYDVVILNPRRDDWDSSWEQAIENPQFREQVAWEQRGLREADFRIFVFLNDSEAPITLLELGENINRPGAVCCEPEYYRKGNVDINCATNGMPVFESLNKLIVHLQTILDEKGLRIPPGKVTAATSPVAPSGSSFVPWFNNIPEGEAAPVERDTPDTPGFRAWFSGSKCVDVNGEPMVVFHGTSSESKQFRNRNGGYGQFGHWFDATPESIEGYTLGDKARHRPNEIAVYLSIKKPKEFPDIDEFKGSVNGRFGPTIAARCQRFRIELKKAGYDGAVIRNSVATRNAMPDYWVAFDQKSIKSATGNSGEFSTEDRSITASAPTTGFKQGRFPTFQEFLESEGGLDALLSHDDWQTITDRFDEPAFFDASPEEQKQMVRDRAFEDQYHAYENALAIHESHRWPMSIYREISLDGGIESLRTADAGIYWSWDIAAAEAHWGSGRNHFLLKGLVDQSAIDWRLTILHNIQISTGEDEKEITLRPGAKIKFVGYKQAEDSRRYARTDDGKWMPLPAVRSLTASHKSATDAKCGSCGCTWDEHYHLPDFSCKNEPGCGCKGWSDQKKAKQAASRESMIREAQGFADQFEGGHPARIAPEGLEWIDESAFDLHRVAGFDTNSTDWKWLARDLWDRAKEGQSLDEAKKYYNEMQQAIKDGTIDPVIVVEGTDRKFYIWDGNHRVALAHELGVDKIPAWVGFQKDTKTAAMDGWLNRIAPGTYRGEYEGKQVEIYRAIYRGARGGNPYRWTLKVDGTPVSDDLVSLRSAVQKLKETKEPDPEPEPTGGLPKGAALLRRKDAASVIQYHQFPTWERYLRSKGGLDSIKPGWHEDYGDDYDFALSEYQEKYEGYTEYLNKLSFPLTVYRAIDAPLDRIDYDRVGVYWAVDPNGAETYGSASAFAKNFAMLTAEIRSPEDVDWAATLDANLLNEEEHEIRVNDGVELRLVKVETTKDEFTEDRMVTASKTAYLSPKSAELTVAFDFGARPRTTIMLDIGIPNFTVFALTFPIDGLTGADLVAYTADALEAVLDEIAAFMLTLKYSEDQILVLFQLARECFRSISIKDASDGQMPDHDNVIQMYEGTFEIPAEFVDETHLRVITAATKVASPEDLDVLKSELTLTPAQQGEELARNYTHDFREFIKDQHPELAEHLAFDEDDYLDDYSAFPPDVLTEFREDYGSEYASHADAPTFLTVEFVRDVKDDWLVHFTDHANAIAHQGFKYGVDDPRMLALTTHLTDNAKQRGGYNFAFEADDASHLRQGKKYGKQFVVFKASGIMTFHYGDNQRQVIFWGADAHDIVPVIKSSETGEWTLRDGDGTVLFESGEITEAVDWVIENYEFYRAMEKGETPEMRRAREMVEEIKQDIDNQNYLIRTQAGKTSVEYIQYEGGQPIAVSSTPKEGYVEQQVTDADREQHLADLEEELEEAQAAYEDLLPKPNKQRVTAAWGSASEQKTGRLESFLSDLWQQTTPLPDGKTTEVVWRDSVVIDARLRFQRIHIETIRSLTEGQSNATAALEFLTGLADKHDVELEVVPVPFGSKRMDQAQLREWYMRHGFKKEGNLYVYHPKVAKTAAAVTTDHPDVMYHGTDSANRESIQTKGLLLAKSEAAQLGGDGAIFLSENKYSHHPESGIDEWAVDIRGLELFADDTTDPEDETDTWWQCFENIPPQRLKLVHAGKIAGKTVKRTPNVRHMELTHLPKDKSNPARVIQLYRNRSLRSLPRPHYVMVYDQRGRGVGVLPLASKWEQRLLSRM